MTHMCEFHLNGGGGVRYPTPLFRHPYIYLDEISISGDEADLEEIDELDNIDIDEEDAIGLEERRTLRCRGH